MSWAEVLKINDNLKNPINKQIREAAYNGARVITASTTFVPEKSGWYKVIVVGAAGATYTTRIGSAGGVGISTLKLSEDSTYHISMAGGQTRFYGDEIDIAANNGKNGGDALGGTAVGAQYNYKGENGEGTTITTARSKNGASVGVFIPELSQRFDISYIENNNYSLVAANSGHGILGYGASAGVVTYEGYNGNALGGVTPSRNGGAVIIIPLEMES
jgi:hypothetical protein